MRVVCQGRHGKQQFTELNRIIIYDDHDNPVLLALKISDGTIWTAGVHDIGFKDALKVLGIGPGPEIAHIKLQEGSEDII